MPGDLGPQCLKCRKRRVKCDSGQPGCHKCAKGGFECPGYIKKPAWTIQTAADIRKKQESRKKNTRDMTAVKIDPKNPASKPSSSSNDDSTSISSSENGCTAVLPRPRRPRLPKLVIGPSLSTLDREAWRLIDSLTYFNYNVRPNMKVLPETNMTALVGLDQWRTSPLTLQYAFVYGMLRHRIITGDSNPTLNSELHHYRGLSFKQMSLLLQKSDIGSVVLSYISVIVLLTVEIQMSCTKLWHCHMDAVWQLTEQLDGAGNLWEVDSGLRGTVNMLLYMDLTSFTTTSAWQLGARHTTGSFLRSGNFENLEDYLFDSPCPCPLEIFTLIADITDLRHLLYQPSQLFTPPESPTAQAAEACLELSATSKGPLDILQSLEAFDTDAWALKMCREYQARLSPHDQTSPTIIKLMSSTASLAKCYQAAAIIYLLRSIQSNHLDTSSLANHADLQHKITHTLPFYKETLALHLSILLETLGHTSNPRAGTNLWRFVNWPLFVDAYERIAWDSEPDLLISPDADYDVIDDFTTLNITTTQTSKRNPELVLARLRDVGRELGANSLFDAAKLLEGVQLGRKYVSGWSWDDAFEERCIFVL